MVGHVFTLLFHTTHSHFTPFPSIRRINENQKPPMYIVMSVVDCDVDNGSGGMGAPSPPFPRRLLSNAEMIL